jgi:putative holliday junction resolvase
MSCYLCLDWGLARIGLAVGWTENRMVTPVGAFEAQPEETLLRKLAKLAKDYEVERLIVGRPLTLEGFQNENDSKIIQWGRKIAEVLGVERVFHDEGLSSQEAGRRLLNLTRKQRRRKELVDALAAAVILEDFFSGLPTPDSP